MENKVTPYSNLKIFAHPDRLNAIKRGEHVAPLYVRLKPTNACNQNCDYCHYGNGKYLDLEGIDMRNQIAWDKLQEIINDMADIGVKAVTFSGGGEPLVYPNIVSAMQLVLEKGIDLSIITNGQCLKGKNAEILTKAKWVRVSLDAAKAETYAKIRGVSLQVFDEICHNLKSFAQTKVAGCELGVNFVIGQDNVGEIYETGKLVKALGANHIKFSARMSSDTVRYHESIKVEANAQILRLQKECGDSSFSVINIYDSDFDICTAFSRKYAHCVVKDVVTVVAADSKVYFCHDKAYLPSGVIGDLQDRSLKELWFAPETIEKFKKFDASKECCHHCAYDDRNVLVNAFLALDDQHINFI